MNYVDCIGRDKNSLRIVRIERVSGWEEVENF